MVTQKNQFSAYCDQSVAYLEFDMAGTSARAKIIKVLASDLVNGRTLSYKLSYMNTQFYFCSVKSALGYTGHGITEKNGAMYKDGRKITRVRTVMTGEEELTYKRLMYVCSLYIDNPEKKTVHTVGNVYYNWY